MELLIEACKEKKCTVVLEIGSLEGYPPDVFSKMAKDQASREKFVLNVMEIVNMYDLGGLLIYWEYPVYWRVRKAFYYTRV